MKFFLDRIKEPSTWSGLGIIATTFFHVPTTTAEAAMKAGVAIAGLVSVLKPESK